MAWYHRVAGGIAHRVWRITRPRTFGVRAILLDQAHRVALVRHTYTDHWYLPGGGVKKGESTLAAIRRELREEIAIENVRIAHVLGVYHSMREGKDDHVVIYIAHAVTDGDTPLCPTDMIEIEQARWFALDDLPDSLSPATRRRIDEYRSAASIAERW
ncbi:NUDIX domain-containing protein [Sphingomonas sanguinis]|uniref:NUDIX domain-containing protein n=1 Tax=Sphingomonas sp. LC-1 TaxID=3110957 RepID=UPI0021BB3BF7|nr:NUDIX domain-containing protein [Sphingomonas sp. LC-1]MCT8001690.1 NUDIX domain-containing protein [Sphingomonas sp. LC-1]